MEQHRLGCFKVCGSGAMLDGVWDSDFRSVKPNKPFLFFLKGL